MEHNPSSEANSHSASQEITLLLRNPKFHYRFHKSPLLVPILNQTHLAQILTKYFLTIHS